MEWRPNALPTIAPNLHISTEQKKKETKIVGNFVNIFIHNEMRFPCLVFAIFSSIRYTKIAQQSHFHMIDTSYWELLFAEPKTYNCNVCARAFSFFVFCVVRIYFQFLWEINMVCLKIAALWLTKGGIRHSAFFGRKFIHIFAIWYPKALSKATREFPLLPQ